MRHCTHGFGTCRTPLALLAYSILTVCCLSTPLFVLCGFDIDHRLAGTAHFTTIILHLHLLSIIICFFFILCLSCPAFLYWYFSKLSFFLALATGDWRSTGLGGHRTCASITKTGKIGNKIARYSIFFFFLETGVEGFTSHGLLILFHCRYWWGYICSLLPFADLPLFYTCF